MKQSHIDDSRKSMQCSVDHTHTHTHTQTHTDTHTQTHTDTHRHTHTRAHAHTHTHTHTHTKFRITVLEEVHALKNNNNKYNTNLALFSS